MPAVKRPLAGRLVRLEHMTEQHAAALFESVTGPDEWAWKPAARPRNVVEMQQILIDNMLDDGSDTREPFIVVRLVDQNVIGATTLFELDRPNRRVEMGWTWLTRSCWGQGFNEDMKCSLLTYCFETLGLLRVAWSADVLNVRSNNQLERCGFVREGVFRSHADRVDGSRRDTVWYSVTADEWPTIRKRLQTLIDERAKHSL